VVVACQASGGVPLVDVAVGLRRRALDRTATNARATTCGKDGPSPNQYGTECLTGRDDHVDVHPGRRCCPVVVETVTKTRMGVDPRDSRPCPHLRTDARPNAMEKTTSLSIASTGGKATLP